MRRRTFLGQAPLALALTARQPHRRPKIEGGVTSSFDPWVEIDEKRLHDNVAAIRTRVGSRPILAVIKNNGYGMGTENVARMLEPLQGIQGFAVVKLQEAVAVRDAGVEKPVLWMGPFDESNLEEAIERDITPMIYTDVGDVLDRVAAKRGRPCGIQICVDTGIGRVGIPHRRALSLIEDLGGRDSVSIEGIMMTFTEDDAFDQEQKRRFRTLTRRVEHQGIETGRLHAASSFALFLHDDFFLDMVRPGMAIYGVYSEQKFRSSKELSLTPALALKARVAYVKRLEEDDSAGYNRAFRPGKPTWVATIPVGHTDGLPRTAASGGKVRIGERMYPIVASVSASHCIVDLGPETTVAAGDEVSIFDARDGSRPEDLSADCGASVYDLTMHLNPLLPRRVVDA